MLRTLGSKPYGRSWQVHGMRNAFIGYTKAFHKAGRVAVRVKSTRSTDVSTANCKYLCGMVLRGQYASLCAYQIAECLGDNKQAVASHAVINQVCGGETVSSVRVRETQGQQWDAYKYGHSEQVKILLNVNVHASSFQAYRARYFSPCHVVLCKYGSTLSGNNNTGINEARNQT